MWGVARALICLMQFAVLTLAVLQPYAHSEISPFEAERAIFRCVQV